MESDKVLWARLTREGRWEAATMLYSRTLSELCESGMGRVKAKREATTIVRAKFPPDLTSGIEPVDEEADPDEYTMPSDLPTGSNEFDADLEWSYRHLGAKVEPRDAPSGAAWALREHGRAVKTRAAYLSMCQKAFSKKSSDDVERNREDRSRQFRLLETLSREFAGLEKT